MSKARKIFWVTISGIFVGVWTNVAFIYGISYFNGYVSDRVLIGSVFFGLMATIIFYGTLCIYQLLAIRESIEKAKEPEPIKTSSKVANSNS